MAADKGHINADLLALADDDESDSDMQDNKSSRYSRSPSRRRSSSPVKRSAQDPTEGNAMLRGGRSGRPGSDDEDAEGSGAESLGSGAMSESESDAPPSAPVDAASLFPIDGKFKDEAERSRIMALPEVERESFLADRSEEIQQAAQSAQLRQIMASRAKQDPQKKRKADLSDDEDRKPKRTAKTKTSDNIANYKRMREEKIEQRRRGDRGRPRTSRSSSRSPDRSDRDASADSEGVEWDDRRPSPPRREPPPTKRNFDRVKVGRTNFAKVCYYPGFEDRIGGCFCRVAIGANRTTGEVQYRMTQIKGFKHGKEYKMEAPNGRLFKTDMYVVLAHGKAEKEWPFTSASDGPITSSEFDRFMAVLDHEGLPIPKVSYLEKKLEDITKLLNHEWTDSEITEKLRKQGWLQDQQESDNAPSSRISSQPIPMDSSAPRSSPSKPLPSANGAKAGGVQTQQERLAALNSRNRQANADAIRKAQIEERKAAIKLQEAMSRGEAVANPFARVKTKARVHYDADRNKNKLLFGEDASDTSRAATPIPGEKDKDKANGAAKGTNGTKVVPRPPSKKRMMDDEVMGSLDLGIDVDI